MTLSKQNYRPILLGSLISLVLACFVGFAQADSSGGFDEIPDPPSDRYLPQDPSLFPPSTFPGQSTQSVQPTLPTAPTVPVSRAQKPIKPVANPKNPKKGFSLFKKKEKPVPDSVIVNVGPRQTAPSPDGLVRLPMPLATVDGSIPAGIYMVRQSLSDKGARELTLVKQNQVILSVVLNVDKQIPVEPVEHLPVKQPQLQESQLSVKVAEDKQSLQILVQQGAQHFISEPLPTLQDQRPELGF